jgi:phage-related protein
MPRTIKFYLETVATGDGITKTRGELEDFERRADSFTSRISGKFRELGGSLMSAGRGMTAFATVPIAGAFVGAFKAASDLNEEVSKVNTVFGEAAPAVQWFAKKAATNIGLSQQAALQATGTFGNMFRQLGLGTHHSSALSQSMTVLASDLGSFHNADISEVIEAQTSAFRGEYDALQRFIPTINAANVQQRAMEQTGKANADQLTDSEKALATYSLMMEGAGAAQGDFARTSDSAANQQRILKARFSDAAAALGNQLMPIFAKAAEFATALLERFNALSPSVQRFVLIGAAVLAVLGPVVGAVGALLTVFGLILSPVGLVIAALVALAIGVVWAYNRFEGFRDVVQPIIAWVTGTLVPKLQEIPDAVREQWGNLVAWVEKHTADFQEAITHVLNVLKAAWQLFGDDILRFVQATWEGIQTVIDGVVQVISGIIRFFLALINGEWGKAWQAIVDIFQGAWTIVLGIGELALARLVFLLSVGWEVIKLGVFAAWEGIKAIISGAWHWVRDTVLAPIGEWLQRNVVDKFWALWEGIRGAMEAIQEGVGNIWGSIKDVVRNSINGVIGFVNTLIRGLNSVLSKIPGVDFRVSEISPVGGGGGGGTQAVTNHAPGAGFAAGGRIGAGFRTSGPAAVVGEGHPSYPEFVIPTDPRYGGRAMVLFNMLGDRLLPRMGLGGILGDVFSAGSNFVGGLVSGAGGVLGDLARQALVTLFRPVNEAIKAGLGSLPNTLGMVDMAQGLRETVWNWVQGADSSLPPPPPAGSGGSTARGSGLFGLHEPVASMAARVLALGSGLVRIVSGWRSFQAQQVLYNRYLAGTGNLAARPGTSKHERGLAVDWGGNQALYQRLWRAQGGHFPVRGEPWHGEAPGYRAGGIVGRLGITHPGEMVLTRADQVGMLNLIRSRNARGTVINIAPGAVVINARPGREGEQDAERAAKRFLDVIAQHQIETDARIA